MVSLSYIGHTDFVSLHLIYSLILTGFLFLFHRQLRKDCQMLLFSATYEDDVMKFAEAVIPNPVVIKLRKDEESLDNIKQFYIECSDQEGKFSALSNIYGSISIGQSMIFCAVSTFPYTV